MKRGTTNHPKTLALMAALGLEQWGAAGVLECVWHFGASFARRGDLGRHSNAAIAAGIGWRGDAGLLVAALVETGWLDPCPCHRLRIHDWPDHADRAVAKTQEVARLGWLECYAPRRPEAVQISRRPAVGDGAGSGEPALEADGEGQENGPIVSGAHACNTRAARVCPAGAGAGAGAGASADGPPPSPPALPRRGEPSPRALVSRTRDAAIAYWTRLGGAPTRRDRRVVWDAVRGGRPLPQVLGSIAELVRDGLLAAGKLKPADPWPPPGLAPFDPPAAPGPDPAPDVAAAEEGRRAWERVSAALEGRVTPEAWATWIRPCRGLWVREGRLVVEVPGSQHLDWIGRTWAIHLKWAAAEIGFEGVDLVTAPATAVGE